MKRSRIVVADDHVILRSGLCRLIGNEPTLELVGETGTGEETLRLVETVAVDVLLLDLDMPRTDPLQLIASLREIRPGMRILVMTGCSDAALLRSVLSAGASGIVLKVSGFSVMRDAIHRVLAGRMFVDSELVLDDAAPSIVPDPLTEREHDVMVMLAQGASYRDIGQRLNISERTVETYRRRIAEKLGLRSRAELISYALRAGLLRESRVLRGSGGDALTRQVPCSRMRHRL